MTRAAYLVELQEALQARKVKERPEYGLLEVWEAIQFLVRWKERIMMRRQGVIIGAYYREYLGVVVFNPGDVLHPVWRKGTEGEKEEWNDLPPDKLRELGVFRANGELSVQVVMKIKDLPAAVRQRIRHIPASLIARERKRFILAGDAKLMADFATKLNNLVNELLATPKVSPELMERTSLELTQTHQLLERSRTSLKNGALQDVQLALQGKFWEIPARTGEAVAELLNQRVRDYEMALKSIELGEKWLGLMLDIERRFRNCYIRLGQLGMRLEKHLRENPALSPTQLLPIANEAYGIWVHLNREVHFNPYYQRLQEDDFRHLQNVVKRAEAGRGQTVLNLIKAATGKLEAVAIGERPTRAELRKEKGILF